MDGWLAGIQRFISDIECDQLHISSMRKLVRRYNSVILKCSNVLLYIYLLEKNSAVANIGNAGIASG